MARGPFTLYATETVRPSGYSGYRCGCNPSYGQSCERCDGTQWWTSARIPEAIPPCMREEPAHV